MDPLALPEMKPDSGLSHEPSQAWSKYRNNETKTKENKNEYVHIKNADVTITKANLKLFHNSTGPKNT